MRRVRLYTNFITEYNRFGNRQALIEGLNNASHYELDVEGCQITSTSAYVDIAVPIDITDIVMFKTTYMLIKNDNPDKTDDYLAFINRVEPNNFNDYDVVDNGVTVKKRSYRFYITIDWWSTIMWQDSENIEIDKIKHSIEGEVYRAHVNDWTADKKPTLIYTDISNEVEIRDLYECSVPLYDSDVKFLILVTTVGSGFTQETYYSGQRNDGLPFGKAPYVPIAHVVPLISGLTAKIKYRQNDEYKLVDNKAITPLSLSDSDIIYAYVVDDIGVAYDKSGDTIIFENFDDYFAGVNNFESIYPNDWSGHKIGGLVIKQLPVKRVNITNRLEEYINTSTYDNTTDIRLYWKDSSLFDPLGTYESYLANGIVKQYCAPYTTYFLSENTSFAEIEPIWLDKDTNFQATFLPSSGTTSVYIPSYKKGGYSRYSQSSRDRRFTRILTKDLFTQIEAGISSAQALGSALNNNKVGGNFGTSRSNSVRTVGAKTIASKSASYSSGLSGSTTVTAQLPISLMSGVYNLIDGCRVKYNNNVQADPDATLSGYSSINIHGYCPLKEEQQNLRVDLALYGYTTYLHPHEVLINHTRKHFNYIRTTSCIVKYCKYNTDIRAQIEEMFNNGVWLWNKADNFGNYEIPNYPTIIGE